ncbi:hypothetical protein U1Q18_032865 [Sarracenia purpurea var. burkii]
MSISALLWFVLRSMGKGFERRQVRRGDETDRETKATNQFPARWWVAETDDSRSFWHILQRKAGLCFSIVFTSHDLSVIRCTEFMITLIEHWI